MKSLSHNEKYEIYDWESLISDPDNFSQFREAYAQVIINPIKFQYNLAKITNETTGAIVPFHPYIYQEEYALDTTRRKILLKSRQVGFTVEEAFLKYWKGYRRNKYEANFVHLREENVKKYIDVIREINSNMVAPLRLKFDRDRDLFIKASNSSRWRGLSSKAVQSGRGFTGEIVLDEFAIVERPSKLLAGAASTAVRGGLELTIGSTPYGKHNDFHRLIEETEWDTKKRCWGSIAEYREVEKEGRKLLQEGYFEAVNIKESKEMMYRWIDQESLYIRENDIKTFYEEYRRVQRNNTSDYSFHCAPWYLCPDLTWSSIMTLNLPYDQLLQEYFLAFLDEATAMLTMDEIDRCIYPDLILVPPSHATKSLHRAVFCGCDPSLGKRNETAWFFVLEPQLNDNNFVIDPWRTLWYESTMEIRKKYVPRLVDQIKAFSPSKIYIDETGIGAAVVEDIQAEGISKGIIEAINLSGKSNYESLIYNLVSLVQGNLLILPDNERLIDQLFALEEQKTATGKKRFTGKIRSSDGQDDLAWALALAVSIGSAYANTSYQMDDVDTGEIKDKYNDYGSEESDERYF